MTLHQSTLTHAQLKDALDYDPETGVFRWKLTLSNRAPAGRIAGTLHRTTRGAYIAIAVYGTSYLAHRLAYLYVRGMWPPYLIDHRNRIGTDNAWSNLRSATRAQNAANGRPHRDLKSGLKGAYAYTNTQSARWYSRIRTHGRSRFLGTYATAQDAHDAYARAAREYFGAFARVE